jgi:sulfite dehydrogenase (cytochrome) subunit B
MRTIAIALAAALITAPVMAEELTITLKKAPGSDKVEINCQVCHSLAYIPMNSPFLNAQGWDAEVAKMINVMGAPIDEADAKTIKDYLTKNYGD